MEFENKSNNHQISCAYNHTHKIFRLSSTFQTLILKDLESKFSRPVTPTEKVITNFTFPYSAMQRKLVEKRGAQETFTI